MRHTPQGYGMWAQGDQDSDSDDGAHKDAMRKTRADERRHVQSERVAERKRSREEAAQRERLLKANEEAAARAAGEQPPHWMQ